MSPEDKPLNISDELQEVETPAARGTDTGKTEQAKEKSPAEIRAEIEETREEMGDTVAAVAAKTDVKAQAQAKVDEVKEQAKAKVDGVKEQAHEKTEKAKTIAKELGDEAKAAAPRSPQEGFRQAQALAKENPRPVAIAGATLALFLFWRVLKS